MWRREVRLTAAQREPLTWAVRYDPEAYRHERAAPIVKVADRAAVPCSTGWESVWIDRTLTDRTS